MSRWSGNWSWTTAASNGNWSWRVPDDALTLKLANRVRRLVEASGRLAGLEALGACGHDVADALASARQMLAAAPAPPANVATTCGTEWQRSARVLSIGNTPPILGATCTRESQFSPA